MNVAIDPGMSDRVCVGDEPRILNAISQPNVAMALWRRSIDPALEAWLDELPATALPDGRWLLSPSETAAAIEPVLPGKAEGRRLFVRDVVGLVRRFAALAASDLVDLRLDRIDNDACRRFHVDKVDIRLLCTYRGPGTMWVPPADRAAALARPDSYDRTAHEMPRFAVGVCRGDSSYPGLVHRSPRLAEGSKPRLLLCLNRPSLASPQRWR